MSLTSHTQGMPDKISNHRNALDNKLPRYNVGEVVNFTESYIESYIQNNCAGRN